MNNLRYRLQNMFRGRYGVDSLTIFLFVVSIIFINIRYMYLIGLAIQIYCLFRMFSTNIVKRQKELQWFKKTTLIFTNAYRNIKSKYQNFRIRQAQKKDFVFIKCKNCKNTLRLPKNKGKLHATCPVCKTEYYIKT